MSAPTLACQDERRRQAVRASERSGIDYVEIDEHDQRILHVHLFGRVPRTLNASNVRIDGGRRIRDLEVVTVELEHHEPDDCLKVRVKRAGDFSTYTLRMVEAAEGGPSRRPLASFDPRYAQIAFSFKIDCPSDLDCASDVPCPPPAQVAPDINYLAKDYATFRQLILDRLALIMPDWRERHVPDVGIMLVELLAYVGDHLSYYQDAVATEAYLDTARLRISVRRHARLVDYVLHEGCNARAWLTIWTDQDVPSGTLALTDVYFATAGEGARTFFEPLPIEPSGRFELYAAHNEIPFYTWGDRECCIPRGATTATLEDGWVFEREPPAPATHAGAPVRSRDESSAPAPETAKPTRALHLRKGDVLIFEEAIGPRTGREEDADPTRRHAVRLTSVRPTEDELLTKRYPNSDREWPTPLVEIEWAAEDALPFPLCISARLDAPACRFIDGLSVAHGNVVLVDHGLTVEREELGQVEIDTAIGRCECDGSAIDIEHLPKPFRPALNEVPLTYRSALPAGSPSAARLVRQDVRLALPQVTLVGLPGVCPTPDGVDEPAVRDGIVVDDAGWRWHPRSDLLASGSQDQAFVVETDDDGRAHLRFGDGESGRRPDACAIFSARYRVGNGPAGNVGAETITAALFRKTVDGLRLAPRNPLPARGGTAAEPIAEAKLMAPGAFRRELERAIVADDYARLAERYAGSRIQRAGASLQWTGSWYAVRVAIDPTGSETPPRRQLDAVEHHLYRYRRIGHDIEVQPARYVPLAIELHVCVSPHYLRGHVKAALREVFSNRALADGRLGFFHPDSLTFGRGIELSRLIATAQAVAGVESVRVTTLQRLGEGDNGERANGILTIRPLEIAQLDNDPSFPEHGTLKLTLEGGR